jgi:hypothetical protein
MSKLIHAAAAFLLAAAGGPVAASEINDPTVGSCTTNNCSSIEATGQVFRSTLNSAQRAKPFVVQLFAGPNECFRVETVFQAQDLELTVVTPSGTVFRDDDSSPLCSVCSLVKFVTPSNQRGWYTVHVSHFGGAPVDAEFRLLYGRYTSGNPNCANPTQPALRSSAK